MSAVPKFHQFSGTGACALFRCSRTRVRVLPVNSFGTPLARFIPMTGSLAILSVQGPGWARGSLKQHRNCDLYRRAKSSQVGWRSRLMNVRISKWTEEGRSPFTTCQWSPVNERNEISLKSVRSQESGRNQHFRTENLVDSEDIY